MAFYGSNYPSNYGGYGGGYSGYPPNSGPPPPPGAGPYAQNALYASAYNVNQYPTYGGYGTGVQGGFYGGHNNQGAVPGFTVPAVQHCQQQYAQQPSAPPAQPPPSMYYQMANHIMTQQAMNDFQVQQLRTMGLLSKGDDEDDSGSRHSRTRGDDDAADDDEDKGKDEATIRREVQEEEMRKVQEKLAADEAMKETLRQRFIDELMRRQDVNGTFDATEGTVKPYGKYRAEDPVTKWFQTKKEQNIAGEEWDSLLDAEYLRYGIKGMGKKDVIIEVVSTRCNAQRNKIMLDYKTSYGRDLIEDLKEELSGDFKECILACFETPARYDAWSVKNAIYGLGTDEEALIEIFMTRTNAQILEMKEDYNKITYKKMANPDKSIEVDIRDDTSGDFKRLLIAATTGNRRLISRDKLEQAVEEVLHNDMFSGMFQVNYEKLVNMAACKRMANELYKAGEARWGTDEETFIRIFSTQDFYTLRQVWNEYVKITQRDITNSVDRETSGDFKSGLRAIATVIKCRPMYFAEKLYKAMKGLGTNDSDLIRICVSRSEVDMVQIKRCFLERYNQTLWKFITDDTSFNYRKILTGLVGKN